MRTLDLAKVVPPDEPLVVLIDGVEHRVSKLSVWEILELRGLDEANPEDLKRIRGVLETTLPTLPKERLDAFSVAEYAAVVRFIMSGEREKAEATAASPTMPEPSSTSVSDG